METSVSSFQNSFGLISFRLNFIETELIGKCSIIKLSFNNEIIFRVSVFHKYYSAGNKILNPGGHRDQIIPLFSSHFKFWVVS